MKKITKEFYISSDWKEFTSEEECKKYELQNQDPIIETEVYLYASEGQIHEQLIDDWFVFDDKNLNLMARLDYILEQTKVKIRLDTTTWKYEVVEFNWRRIEDK